MIEKPEAAHQTNETLSFSKVYKNFLGNKTDYSLEPSQGFSYGFQ